MNSRLPKNRVEMSLDAADTSVCATRVVWLALLLVTLPVASQAQAPAGRSREAFQRLCGTCHKVEAVITSGRTREQWQETIVKMVTLGLKATDEEMSIALEYLVANYGRAYMNRGRGPLASGPGAGPAQPPRGGGAGADDKHVVDAAAADRGRKTYAAECINCHGTHARGTERGVDLIRSVLVLRDRYGSEIGPYLRQGHPTQTTPSANLSPTQIEELSHFVHYEVYQTLRSALEIQNVLTGDAKAGAEYFNGSGKCNTCHSPAGDLAGIGKRYDPPTLQQRFLFPRTVGFGRRRFGGPPPKPVTVVVTPPDGPAMSGELVHMDDFNVSLRDSSGEYHSWKRTPQLKVVKNDPYAAHVELLDKYTDKNMHDIVAYLETLK